ncbi:MAG: hypothetical protein IPK19_14050 [Chloroflexi bacterium]|nr:hypothetical protein [Chloroflexota bacterium]
MSGLIGVFNLDGRPIERSALEPMFQRIGYRGRDAQALWVDGTVGLGVTLQHVTRRDRGDVQPRTQDGVTLIADSLLVARPELVEALQRAGRDVRTAMPDSELIVHAYLAWDEACLEHLTGEFVFILWDARKKRFFAAHDPMAVRELYYAALPGTLVVSNELVAVMKHPSVSKALDPAIVGDFLLFSVVGRHDKYRTMFQDARRMAPAYALRATAEKGVETWRYWDFPYDEPLRRLSKPDDYVAEFRAMLMQVVKERVEDLDRVSLMMSGGMDSTTVAAIITHLNRSGEINTPLTVVSQVFDRIALDSEAYFATITGKFLGLPVDFLVSDTYLPTQPPIGRAEPMQDFNGTLIMELEQRLAAGGAMALSGNGGDEVCPATPLYEVLLLHSLPEAIGLYRWLWQMTGSRPGFGGLRAYVRRLLMFGREPSAPAPVFPYPAWLEEDFAARHDLRERLRTPSTYTLKGSHRTQPEIPLYVRLGKWNNRTEFAAEKAYRTVHVGMPFVDTRLIRFAMSVPPYPFNRKKLLLRRAMQGMLPNEVLKRPKTGAPPIPMVMLQQPGVEWIDHWEIVPEAAEYIRRDRVPAVYNTDSIERAVIDTRPMFFNEWLRAIRAEIGG